MTSMQRLFIIGNGFDMAHGLPTSYTNNLKPILKKMNRDLFKKVDLFYFILDNGKEDYWSKFESHIGLLTDQEMDKLVSLLKEQVNKYFENLPKINDFLYSETDENFYDTYTEKQNAVNAAANTNLQFKAEPFDKIDEIKKFIDEGFKRMIEEANDNLKIKEKKGDIEFCSTDYFINFNYTKTLEKVYEIDKSKILYIHGNMEEELLWGNEKRALDNLYYKLENQFSLINTINPDNPFKYNPIEIIKEQALRGKISHKEAAAEMEFYEELLHDPSSNDYYEASSIDKKNIEEISENIKVLNKLLVKELSIDKLIEWVQKNNLQELEIERITVYGHSLGSVDQEYFEKIDSFFKPKIWEVSYYSSDDIVKVNAQNLSFYNKVDFFSNLK